MFERFTIDVDNSLSVFAVSNSSGSLLDVVSLHRLDCLLGSSGHFILFTSENGV
jgi:hypothetical protein